MLRTQIQTFRGQTDGSYEVRTFLGQDYYVVPVVAMVEGVRFGANQESAELGLASEFGKFVDGWNNSPIVLGHPQVDGAFVSASAPAVLEAYQIGFMSASKVDDKKLKCEAWLAVSQRDKSDEAKSVFTRVEANEMIEVSVGFFTDVEEKTGNFNGQSYTGIWRNIVPDHLAFLAEGVLGACSIADGCGTPRVNANSTISAIKEGVAGMFRADKAKKGKMKKGAEKLLGSCACNGAENVEPVSLQTLETGSNVTEDLGLAVQRLVAQAIPGNLLNADVYRELSGAVKERYGYVYLYGYTTEHVVFEDYDSDSGSWHLYRQTYTIADDGLVTLTGEAERVRLITNIIPVDNAAGDGITANESSTQETDMTEQTAPAAETPAAVTETPTAPAAAAEVAPVAQAAPIKAQTADEYVASAPAEIREVLGAAMKAQAARKEALIKSLQDSGRCDLGVEFLKAQNVETLEGLAKLAAVPSSFDGVAAPTSRAQAAEDAKVPAAPVALVRKAQ